MAGARDDGSSLWRTAIDAVRDDPALLVLVLVNVAVGIDILWSQGGLQTAVFVYWLELAVVAVFTAIKMPFVHRIGGTLLAAVFAAVCYFMMRGLLAIFGALALLTMVSSGESAGEMLEQLAADLALPLLWLVLSHAYSFWRNFIVRAEYERASLEDLFAIGFVRVGLTWLGILPALLIAMLIHPAALVGLVIVGKIALDVVAHQRSHKRIRGRRDRAQKRARSLSRELTGLAPYAVFFLATSLVSDPLRELSRKLAAPIVDRAEDSYERSQPEPLECTSGVLEPCRLNCAEGDSEACATLAWSYRRGQGVDEDPIQARLYFEKGCALALGHACGQVGSAYFFGDRLGVSRDYRRAVTFTRQGCEAGDASSCYFFGVCLAQGLGVATDRDAAVRAFDRGCELGKHEAACQWAGRLRVSQ